jgi:hypothetical protein
MSIDRSLLAQDFATAASPPAILNRSSRAEGGIGRIRAAEHGDIAPMIERHPRPLMGSGPTPRTAM